MAGVSLNLNKKKKRDAFCKLTRFLNISYGVALQVSEMQKREQKHTKLAKPMVMPVAKANQKTESEVKESGRHEGVRLGRGKEKEQ